MSRHKLITKTVKRFTQRCREKFFKTTLELYTEKINHKRLKIIKQLVKTVSGNRPYNNQLEQVRVKQRQRNGVLD